MADIRVKFPVKIARYSDHEITLREDYGSKPTGTVLECSPDQIPEAIKVLYALCDEMREAYTRLSSLPPPRKGC